jgi:hypothetical protein
MEALMGDTHGKHLRQIPESCQLRDRAAANRKDSAGGISVRNTTTPQKGALLLSVT